MNIGERLNNVIPKYGLKFLVVFFTGTQVLLSQNKITQNMSGTIVYNYSAKKDKSEKEPDKVYSFKVFNQTYETIKSGISVTKGVKWDTQDFCIPLGFDFKLYGKSNDTIIISDGTTLTFDNMQKDSVTSFASAMFEDLCDASYDPRKNEEGKPGGTSNIVYTTEGETGKRICKIEVKDAAFYNEKLKNKENTGSRVSFQVWLYEEDNSIEFRFGDIHISEPFENLFNGPNGFMSGLVNQLNSNTLNAESSNFLSGNSSQPEMVSLSNTLSEAVSLPVEKGLVYRFTYVRKTSEPSVKKQPENNLFMYPNPAKDKLFFSHVPEELIGSRVIFYDALGKEIFTTNLSHMLDISHLSSGVYYVDVCNKENTSVVSRKLIVEK